MAYAHLRPRIQAWSKSHESELEEFRFSLYILRQNKLTVIGFIIIAGLVFVALFAPFIAPYSPLAVDMSNTFSPPGAAHLFGTDELGMDIFSRVLYGTRISLMVSMVVVASALTIGTLLGGISGFYGEKVDELIMRITDIFLAFPSIVLALAIGAALGPGIVNMMFALSFTWWPWYARLVRGQILSIRESQYIEAATSVGGGRFHILVRHVLVNCIAPLVVNASMDMGYVILAAASLGFLGIGAQPPTPEWGLMISTGRLFTIDYWWLAAFPGFAITISVIAFNLVGDGLRDVLDPRLRRFGR